MHGSDRLPKTNVSVGRPRIWPLWLAVLLVSFPSWRAVAADTAVSPKLFLEQNFLRIEPSFWDTFGIRLSKGEQPVRHGLFSVVSDEAVRGSTGAGRHVDHARVWQGLVIGFAVSGVGLIGGGLAEEASEKQWNGGAKVLVAGGVLFIFLEYIAALSRQNEIAAAVSSYNEDLVLGRLTD